MKQPDADPTGARVDRAAPHPEKSFLAELLIWVEADLLEHGDGPSGGFRLRVDRVKAEMQKAEAGNESPVTMASLIKQRDAQWYRAEQAEADRAALRAHLEEAEKERDALLEMLDWCTCGHRRSTHHEWGRCHGRLCHCTKFVLEPAQAETDLVTCRAALRGLRDDMRRFLFQRGAGWNTVPEQIGEWAERVDRLLAGPDETITDSRAALRALVEQWRDHAAAIRVTSRDTVVETLIAQRVETLRECAEDLARVLAGGETPA